MSYKLAHQPFLSIKSLKTNTSLRAFLTQGKKITDARLLNKLTGKVITLRKSIFSNVENINLPLSLTG
ncbi:MAG: hypothetical protein ACKO13_04960 [Cytophagales bacterium]